MVSLALSVSEGIANEERIPHGTSLTWTRLRLKERPTWMSLLAKQGAVSDTLHGNLSFFYTLPPPLFAPSLSMIPGTITTVICSSLSCSLSLSLSLWQHDFPLQWTIPLLQLVWHNRMVMKYLYVHLLQRKLCESHTKTHTHTCSTVTDVPPTLQLFPLHYHTYYAQGFDHSLHLFLPLPWAALLC